MKNPSTYFKFLLVMMVVLSPAHAEEDPTLLQLAMWLATYDMKAVESDELSTWTCGYPVDGSTVEYFIWEVRTIVPAYGLPPEHCEGLISSLDILTNETHRDSISVRVAGVDELGHQGPWSQRANW